MATNKYDTFLALALAALLGLGLASCENTPLTGPDDGELRLSVSQITIDEAGGKTEGTGTLAAQLFDAAGRPMVGAQVIFSSPYGTLASGGPPNFVETNSSGIAIDQLTVSLADPDTFEVTAFSGRLMASDTISRSSNPRPVAMIVASPDAESLPDRTVTFSGFGSTGQILCHEWVIDTDLPGVRTQTVQRSGSPTSYQDSYSEPQGLDVTLRVGSTACASDPTLSVFNGEPDTIRYDIVCDQTKPVAVISAPSSTLSGVAVTLDGSQSYDPDGSTGPNAIVGYRWTCPNGTPSTASGAVVTCTFTISGTTAQIRSPTLVVTNQCGLESNAASVNITVTP